MLYLIINTIKLIFKKIKIIIILVSLTLGFGFIFLKRVDHLSQLKKQDSLLQFFLKLRQKVLLSYQNTSNEKDGIRSHFFLTDNLKPKN